MNKARISVVIPAHNAGAFIGEAVDSVLKQTRAADELIVVDDCSTDDTCIILNRFGSGVSLIRNTVNRGPGFSRNHGVSCSSGSYVAFLDADDYWTPDHLKNMMAILEAHTDVGMAFCPVRLVGDADGIWPSDVSKYLEPRHAFMDVLRNIPCIPSALMIRRHIHDAVQGFDEERRWEQGRLVQAEDLDYVTRIALDTQVMASPEATVNYRQHAGQSSVIPVQQMIQAFRYRLHILDLLVRRGYPQSFCDEAKWKVICCWEENLDKAWREGDLRRLRLLVRFGQSSSLLAEPTRLYTWRAFLPRFVRRMGYAVKHAQSKVMERNICNSRIRP
jgi:glycosyltransferase involved in cell wall biosynthesis